MRKGWYYLEAHMLVRNSFPKWIILKVIKKTRLRDNHPELCFAPNIDKYFYLIWRSYRAINKNKRLIKSLTISNYFVCSNEYAFLCLIMIASDFLFVVIPKVK